MHKFGRILVLIALVQYDLTNCQKLMEIFSWSKMDYFYPTLDQKREALLTEELVPENSLPVGIEVWRDKLFVSVPRWRPGIPATLNYIPLDVAVKARLKSPMLIPYPSLKGNEVGNCATGLNTVYRIKADACDRLWVLDTGTYGYDNTSVNLCPYTIKVFDLNTNQVIRRYQFRPEDTNANTFIANIAVDIGESCEDTFAYFSDELGYGLISYSWQKNDSWRFSNSYFLPDPLAGDFNIAGLNFQWGFEGIFGMALSQKKADGFRTMFFNPLASNHEFAVTTAILRNKNRTNDSFHDFVPLASRGPNSHVTASVMDENGILFYNLIDQNSIGCWNSQNPYHPSYQATVDRDDTKLIFPSDVKVVGDYLWVMSDRMPVFLESTLNYTDTNFRIFFAPIEKLIKNTICEKNSYLLDKTKFSYLK